MTAARVAAVIPAYLEADTVGTVVDVVKQSTLVDDVVVVDNDGLGPTADAAVAHGARVVSCTERGKGQAMAAGVAATDAEIVLFLDADLIGLTVQHVDRLVTAVHDGTAMAMGLFDRGGWQNWWFLNVLPILTGQRALRREVWDELHPDDYRGYKVEASLNSLCSNLELPTAAFVCDGLWHRTKEEKFEHPVVGFAVKQAMLLTAVWGYASFRVRRHLVRPLRRRAAEVRQAGRHRF